MEVIYILIVKVVIRQTAFVKTWTYRPKRVNYTVYKLHCKKSDFWLFWIEELRKPLHFILSVPLIVITTKALVLGFSHVPSTVGGILCFSECSSVYYSPNYSGHKSWSHPWLLSRSYLASSPSANPLHLTSNRSTESDHFSLSLLLLLYFKLGSSFCLLTGLPTSPPAPWTCQDMLDYAMVMTPKSSWFICTKVDFSLKQHVYCRSASSLSHISSPRIQAEGATSTWTLLVPEIEGKGALEGLTLGMNCLACDTCDFSSQLTGQSCMAPLGTRKYI